MITLRVNMPWGVFWDYKVSAVPRLGEHIQINGVLFLVTEIRHVPLQDEVRIGVKHADK